MFLCFFPFNRGHELTPNFVFNIFQVTCLHSLRHRIVKVSFLVDEWSALIHNTSQHLSTKEVYLLTFLVFIKVK